MWQDGVHRVKKSWTRMGNMQNSRKSDGAGDGDGVGKGMEMEWNENGNEIGME